MWCLCVGGGVEDSFESGALRRSEISTVAVWFADAVKADGTFAKVDRSVSVASLTSGYCSVMRSLVGTSSGTRAVDDRLTVQSDAGSKSNEGTFSKLS